MGNPKSSVNSGCVCRCQDSNGEVCNRPISDEEMEDDGMCHTCADHVYVEMRSETEFKWFHDPKRNLQ